MAVKSELSTHLIAVCFPHIIFFYNPYRAVDVHEKWPDITRSINPYDQVQAFGLCYSWK